MTAFDLSGLEKVADKVKSDLFKEERQIPGIAWQGHLETPIWTMQEGVLPYTPKGFRSEQVKFGKSPSAPKQASWVSESLTGVVVSVRERMVITAKDGKIYYYPPRTPKNKRVEGRYGRWVQVLFLVSPEDENVIPETPMVIGLPAMYKSASWDNNPNANFNLTGFGKGVWVTAKEALMEQNRKNGTRVPPECFLELTMGALQKPDGSYNYMTFGTAQKSEACPFTLTGLRLAKPELAEMAQKIREQMGLEWTAEWEKPEENAANRDDYLEEDKFIVEEDDEIPF